MESFICRLITSPIITSIPILLILSHVLSAAAAAPTTGHHPSSSSGSTNFIKTSCGATLYPTICYNSLSSYANSIQTNPTQLATAALNVTLNSAKAASRMVSWMSRQNNLGHKLAGAVTDCVESMGYSVDELRRSLAEMKDLKGPEFAMKMGNVQTWASAALTDEDTCMDGFEGSGFDGKIKDTVRSHIVKVAQLTSNALALINRIN